MSEFFQQPPRAGNRFHTDPSLRLLTQWHLPDAIYEQAEPQLERMGALADEVMGALAEQAETNEPEHTPYDAWGRRIDRVRIDDSWRELMRIGQREGLVAIPHERAYGAHSRVVQAGLVHLYDPASAVADCPLVMTDGAVTLLQEHDPGLAEHYNPRLTAREGAWTAGQWMTEKEGGSDVSGTSTVASQDADGRWRLYGTKWFTSAVTADMALALARAETSAGEDQGLSLFLLELRNADDTWNGLEIRRLKDKLGTRALPTAEIDLVGAAAVPVGSLGGGVRKLAGLLNVARFWAAIGGPAGVGQLLALARDYAGKREAFGSLLRDNPIHRRWLARISADYEAMLALNFETAAQLGQSENGGPKELARLLAPLNKLACARQAAQTGSELLESFGGAGYVEDTGIPRLFRNLHVHCIWEGTTSVLAHDVVRALGAPENAEAFADDICRRLKNLTTAGTARVKQKIESELDVLMPLVNDPREEEARRIGWGMARIYQGVLLAEFAEWKKSAFDDDAGFATAELFCRRGLVDEPFPETDADTAGRMAFGS
ncbi:acyl-CoA dehydrogenase family protein [Aquisalimonas lutea]|uniref:acyl-CoA dehydrogenase family protein n=1 Tax=Aquisalimonas lutea TaxID=1327750 RepID=UPI0025B5E02E|nr:acyl-CoA dehydrogenase family protein [Aquisalimonas lutea]MDN3519134.1 acyl-CoA dehydrogenase family protein [Aquisalimonas lutea]